MLLLTFYHVYCIKPKETTKTFKKKTMSFFHSAFTLLISSLSFKLLIMLLNNLPVSFDGPLTVFERILVKNWKLIMSY